MNTVPRIGRVLDLVGLAIFATGGAVFARAWIGFQGVPTNVPPPGADPWAAVGIANGYWRLQKIGTALMIAGTAVFVLAWWSARSAAASVSDPAGDSPAT